MTATGAINDAQIGRVTLAYTADGSTLYAIVESSTLFNHPSAHQGGTNLMGDLRLAERQPGRQLEQDRRGRQARGVGLGAAGVARATTPASSPGTTSSSPSTRATRNHVYVGLEEVFETTDGGSSWKAIGPYWNFGLKCATVSVNDCPSTTHPDQHAIAIAGDTVYIGNDGGVYSRSLDNHSVQGWNDLNENLHSLQYYFAGSGQTEGGEAIWGGLQDNGVSLLLPDTSPMISPFGGDGGDTIVDPANANRAVVEYVGLDMAQDRERRRSRTGRPRRSPRSPRPAVRSPTRRTPATRLPRFIAPFEADPQNLDHWVAGGRYVWDNGGLGWDTTCGAKACDWTIVHDTGAGRSITAIAVDGDVTYAAWCGPCNPPGFASGIDTNYDPDTGDAGDWHTLDLAGQGLPNRFVAAVTIAPDDPGHVYAVYNGFSRRWVQGGGIGHVFETTDGGGTWTDVSGNLPDAPSDDLLVVNGQLVLATDIGVFIAVGRQRSGHLVVAIRDRATERLDERPIAHLRRRDDHRRDARPRTVVDRRADVAFADPSRPVGGRGQPRRPAAVRMHGRR